MVGRLQPHNNNIIDVDQQLLSLEELLSNLIKSFCKTKRDKKAKLSFSINELKITVQRWNWNILGSFT